ncbi:S26 family signal peptidase [Streptomyces sp. NBC_00291]|uniref:S26 family signal peptidase n=1 Tax=Streptomyces sp. NBC_00291 TaxID=2975704 RepID=UPI002254941E|nr:S26 family signal peptidase [Streptomyces sp. NBC_00291]MCX5155473.1 S26 family signal peptidase [Streptomyces sp. NBC_00291]
MEWLIGAGGALVLGLVSAGWARRNLVAVTVHGQSMNPTLGNGDKVIVRRGVGGLRRGRIVVVTRPEIETGWARSSPATVAGLGIDRGYIKRAVALGGDAFPSVVGHSGRVPPNHVVVLGDNPVSTDSKKYGPCPEHQILGVMLWRLSRA